MAITHIQPLFLFLASLFFLPALQAIDFENCSKNGTDFGTVVDVEIYPDPVGREDYELSIMLVGVTKESIGKLVIDVYVKSEKITHLLNRFDFCAMGWRCQIEAGSNFMIPLPEVLNYVLEGDYKFVVVVLDEEDSTERMCIDFHLPTSAPKLVSA